MEVFLLHNNIYYILYNGDNMLIVNNLKKNYHTLKDEIKTLDNISFELKENEFISIVGPSGCGKSTILSILAGIIDKSDGIIICDKTIGYMLQDDLLFEWLTIYDNCLLGLKIQNKLTKENKKYVLDLLEKYGLKDYINMYPNNLSGGMRQRVALIRTLAIKPEILLLDEAFSKLDSQTKKFVLDDIYNILREEKISCIMVTHDISDAISFSDKILILHEKPSSIKKEIKTNMKELPSKRIYKKEYLKLLEEVDDNV